MRRAMRSGKTVDGTAQVVAAGDVGAQVERADERLPRCCGLPVVLKKGSLGRVECLE